MFLSVENVAPRVVAVYSDSKFRSIALPTLLTVPCRSRWSVVSFRSFSLAVARACLRISFCPCVNSASGGPAKSGYGSEMGKLVSGKATFGDVVLQLLDVVHDVANDLARVLIDSGKFVNYSINLFFDCHTRFHCVLGLSEGSGRFLRRNNNEVRLKKNFFFSLWTTTSDTVTSRLSSSI